MNDEEVIYFNQSEGFKFMEFLDHVPLHFKQNLLEYKSNQSLDYFDVETETKGFRIYHDYLQYKGLWKIEKKLNECSKEFYDKIKLKQNFSSERWRTTIKITETNEKISFKIFWFFSEKKFGRPYFKVHTVCQFVTYNKKKKLFYHGKLVNYHKKRNFIKSVRVLRLNGNPYSLIQSYLMGYLVEDNTSDVLVSQTKNQLSCNITKLFMSRVFPDIKDGEDYETITFKKMYEARGVKLPDNWKAFLDTYIGPLKKIKTPNSKLIEMLMKQSGLKGDKINKAFHMVKSFTNPECIKFAMDFFGEKFILSQNIDFLVTLLECPYSFHLNAHKDLNFTKKEKNNILEILKLVAVKHININTFSDHFYMLNKLKGLEKVKWESNSLKTFSEEHLALTEKISFYTKGILIRNFDENFLKTSQQEVILNDTFYFPILLTTTGEYNEESFIQSNCVKTYIDKSNSIIFSIRKGSNDSTERITVEFQFKQVNEHVLLKRVQTLGRFNQPIKPDFEEVCKVFDERIKTFLINNELKLPNVQLVVGGKLFNSKIVFNDDRKYFTFENPGFTHILNFGFSDNLRIENGWNIIPDNLENEVGDFDDYTIVGIDDF